MLSVIKLGEQRKLFSKKSLSTSFETAYWNDPMLRQPRFQGANFEGQFLRTRLVLRKSVCDRRTSDTNLYKYANQTGKSHSKNILRQYLFTVVVN